MKKLLKAEILVPVILILAVIGLIAWGGAMSDGSGHGHSHGSGTHSH
jgi:hypothetical protein